MVVDGLNPLGQGDIMLLRWGLCAAQKRMEIAIKPLLFVECICDAVGRQECAQSANGAMFVQNPLAKPVQIRVWVSEDSMFKIDDVGYPEAISQEVARFVVAMSETEPGRTENVTNAKVVFHSI